MADNSYTLTGLDTDTVYRVRVRARDNDLAEGAWSDVVSTTTQGPGGGAAAQPVWAAALPDITPLPDAVVGEAYSYDLKQLGVDIGKCRVHRTNKTAIIESVPNLWVMSADLPEGLTLNEETGVISGVPTVEGEKIVFDVITWRGDFDAATDWSDRTSAAGVLWTDDFPDEATLRGMVDPLGSGNSELVQWDTSQFVYGTGAMRQYHEASSAYPGAEGNYIRYTLDGRSPADPDWNPAGEIPHLEVGETVYMSFLMRNDKMMSHHQFLQANGSRLNKPKILIVDNKRSGGRPDNQDQQGQLVVTQVDGLIFGYHGASGGNQISWGTLRDTAIRNGDTVRQPDVDYGANPLTGTDPGLDSGDGAGSPYRATQQDRGRWGLLRGYSTSLGNPDGRPDPLTAVPTHGKDWWVETYVTIERTGATTTSYTVQVCPIGMTRQDVHAVTDNPRWSYYGRFMLTNSHTDMAAETSGGIDLRPIAERWFDGIIVSSQPIDPPSNYFIKSDIARFFIKTVPSGTVDTTPPVISNQTATPGETSAVVTFNTDELATIVIDYGLTTGYGSQVTGTANTSHSITIPSLFAGTLYNYRITATDLATNATVDSNRTFTTDAADTTGPIISDVTVGNITSAGAVITATTDEPADMLIDYGETTGYGSQAQGASSLLSHSVPLSGLTANTLYHYRATCTDDASNGTVDIDRTFTTLTAGTYNGIINDVNDLINMPSGTWGYVPDSQMSAAEKPRSQYSSPSAYDFVQGTKGFTGITAFSGGAFDTLRNRLMICGGGHNDYHGNEVPVFSLSTMTWTRITDPSEAATAPSGGVDPWPDGTPSARHTYAFLEYDPNSDRLMMGPGGLSSSNGGSGGRFWYLPLAGLDPDPVQAKFDWVNTGSPPFSFGADPHSVWDTRLNRLFVKSTTPSQTGWWNGSSWTGGSSGGGRRFAPLVYDAANQRFLGIGQGAVYQWNASDSGQYGSRTQLSTSGVTVAQSASNPGLGYRPVDQKVWAWAGGTDMYTFDASNTWTRVAASGANLVTPFSLATSSNDFLNGKFRYIPDYDAFIMARDDPFVGPGIYFYKP